MVKVKICGITNLEDALASFKAGCDALGFVFYKKSPRYIAPEKARSIAEQLPAQVIKIGIFVNARERTVRRIARLCSLNMLQFHGNETPEFCRRFADCKIIKAFRVKGRLGCKDVLKYRPFAFLFDTYAASKIGGTGKNFDWELITHINNIKGPVFLSGGLSAKNVKAAIRAVKPHWVDVSSSVEAAPGKKDHKKVREFIKTVKGNT